MHRMMPFFGALAVIQSIKAPPHGMVCTMHVLCWKRGSGPCVPTPGECGFRVQTSGGSKCSGSTAMHACALGSQMKPLKLFQRTTRT
jgi:hypothetical protein